MLLLLLLLLLLLGLLAAPLRAETLAIVNARLATVSDPEPYAGTIVLRDGRIAAVGRNVRPPAHATILDGAGRWVTPGIFGGFTRLGVIELDSVDPTDDSRAAGSPFSAAVSVVPGINPAAAGIAINRIAGVTRAAVAPRSGRRIFAGQGVVIGLGDASAPVMAGTGFLYVELGERGAMLAGGSRGAAIAELRHGLREAERLAAHPQAFEGGRERESILPRLDAEALVPVARGRMPALFHADRASDLLALLRLLEEFPRLRPVVVGGAEAWRVADALARARVPVIASATTNLPARFELLAATQSNVGRLVRAGVTVALGLVDESDGSQVRLLPQQAGNLVALNRLPGATGLSHAEALAAITLAPARIFGLGHELGSLERGKRADLVLWDGDPLELSSAPAAVFIDGARIPLVSRQTELRDRYLDLKRGDLPPAYRVRD